MFVDDSRVLQGLRQYVFLGLINHHAWQVKQRRFLAHYKECSVIAGIVIYYVPSVSSMTYICFEFYFSKLGLIGHEMQQK